MENHIMEAGRITTIAASAAEWAMSKVGCPYSQERRTAPGIFDCSSLVARAYTAQGKKWKYGGDVPRSNQEVYDDDFELLWPSKYEDIGKKMGTKEVIAKAGMPGDVQYLCTDSSTERANRITHVALVTTASRIVHARGTKYGVTTSPVTQYSGRICAVSRYNPSCTLRAGMKGWRTYDLQALLLSGGYSISVDGEYGMQTADAVRDYQKRHGLSVTGEADVATIRALSSNKAPTENTNTSGSFGDASKIVVTGEAVNLREGPGTECRIVTRVYRGNILPVIDQWTPVISDGRILWISAKYVRPADD